MEFGERNLPFHHRVLVVLLALLAMCGLVATHASAADITSRVAVTKTPTAGTYDEWADIRIDIGWSVATAAPGDTFIVPLDKYLDARRFVPMDLKDAAGAVVARVTIMKDANGAFLRFPDGDAKLQFTFTSYAGTHTNLSGHAWFQIRFDHSKLTFPDGGTTMDITVYGTPLVITTASGPVGNERLKYGFWISPNNNEAEATAQNPDGTNANPGADIIWNIQLQGGTASLAKGWTRATITDTPATGSHFVCPLTPRPWATIHDDTTTRDVWLSTTAVQVSVASCTSSSLTLTVTKAAADNGIYRVHFPGWVNDGALPDGFGNTATIDYDGPGGRMLSYPVTTMMDRALAGGDGTGVDAPPSIDIENYCGSWGGVVFTDGIATLVGGQPSPQPTPCDYDAAPGLPVTSGTATNVQFRVTNTGTEVLNNVLVTDTTLTGTPLTNIVCTRGESKTMPFNGLAPQESFFCTATLPAITAPHGNRAVVTGVGAESAIAVTDNDAWYAQPKAVLPPAGTPKLTIKKVATITTVKAGKSLKWRITVRNIGTAAAINVKVCDVLRDTSSFPTTTVTYTIGTSTKVARMRIAAGKGCITIPRLATGKAAVVTVTTTVPKTTRRKSVRNTATAAAVSVATVTSTASVKVIGIAGVSVIPSPAG
jgi:uncharacterized repeat protein (TIGR01451 family)